MRNAKTAFKLTTVLLILLSIPLTIYLVFKVQQLEKRAVSLPTIITIDLSERTPLLRIWQNLAQGGEVPIPQLPVAVQAIRELDPGYVRIDHIFDAYKVVRRDARGNIFYDFSLLDQEVEAIRKSGATPFFSISYIPADLASAQNPNRPASYEAWQEAVSALVAYYSGKKNKNIENVFYEVYNEPDLFGKWQSWEYALLYEASVKGATAALDTNKYFIGGPALSYFDREFIRSFIEKARETGLRVDFISWHTYDTNPEKIAQEAEALNLILKDTPFQDVFKVVSEWGSYPEKHFWHDSLFDASHLVAAVSRSLGYVDMLIYFEIKDGRTQDGRQFFGGWGILSNEEFGLLRKPRFFALLLLSRLKAFKFRLFGENENVSAIATGNSKTDLTMIITHYSKGASNAPLSVPLRIINMLPGIYEVRKIALVGRGPPKEEEPTILSVETGEGLLTIDLPSDSVVALDVVRKTSSVKLTSGKTGALGDQAAKVSPPSALLYEIAPKEALGVSEVSFSFRSDTPLSQLFDTSLFKSSGSLSTITLSTETHGFKNMLVLSVDHKNGRISSVSLPILQEETSRWHNARLILDNKRALLSLSLDGTIVEGALRDKTSLSETLSFGEFEGAIDDISVSLDGNIILSETF